MTCALKGGFKASSGHQQATSCLSQSPTEKTGAPAWDLGSFLLSFCNLPELGRFLELFHVGQAAGTLPFKGAGTSHKGADKGSKV